jgi:hypothetical protein
MTLLALLAVGVLGSAGSAWGLARGGTAARAGALGGVLALVAIAVLAAASPTPGSLAPDSTGAIPGTLWNGALVPGAYLRLVVELWATTSVVLAGVAWLLRGTAGLRALVPASLAALVGTAVTLAASTPSLGIVAGAATGLASIPVVLATPRVAAAGIAAREVRNAVATGLVLLAVASVAPVVARLVLANPDSSAGSGGSGAVAAVSFGLLASSVVVAARVGGIPYHVRISALTDIVPAGSVPLVVAWLPLPLAAAAVGLAVGVLAPLAPPVGTAQALIVAATLLATLAASLAAFLQDDLRHAVGYMAIADLGLVVLALAALDPAVWGPARTWLLTIAVTKTALAAWAAVAEDRFETRSVPELRGWLRPSPILGSALVLIIIATCGLPGWAVMTARADLTGHVAEGPWSTLLLIASLLAVPAYLRWLWLGLGAPTSHVERSAPELTGLSGLSAVRAPARRLALTPPRRARGELLPVEQEAAEGAGALGPDGADITSPAPADARPVARPAARAPGGSRRAASTMRSTSVPEATTPVGRAALATGDAEAVAQHRPRDEVRADAATRAATTARGHRTGLLSGAALALALLASLVAFGAFGVTSAAGEPTPAVAGIDASGN